MGRKKSGKKRRKKKTKILKRTLQESALEQDEHNLGLHGGSWGTASTGAGSEMAGSGTPKQEKFN